MSMQTIRKPLSYLLTPIFALSLALGISAWPQEAQAHKGHAGSNVVFMQKKAALKEMLPAGARITKRKQPLKEDAAAWAEKTYGIELDDKLYSYYLATDKTSKAIAGAAYVGEKHYRHGDLKFAVGIDANQRITQVAILGINEKYVVDFEGNVGTGLIADYAGLSLQELIAKTDELASSDKATREFSTAVRDAAVLLAAFLRDAK
ncbi:MAG TPA: hypothetical protein ENJ65_00905 [Candidatus Tenderia electrophaga]|uniref:FMN-binding domain-containing protein n=1 Tax=Candidatus Tenderia electrophaga TaxID=1748243 RepID=A0A832J410_9GAMM|nr:hypothetical protein [Candidatus Tenderia electrophaga]